MADVEALLVPWLTGQREDTRFCTETPADLETIPETVQVVRAGGGQQFVLARPRIVLGSFAIATDSKSARMAARDLAYAIDDLMLWSLRGSALGDYTVTKVEQTSGPTFIPDANVTLRHFAATYTVTIR